MNSASSTGRNAPGWRAAILSHFSSEIAAVTRLTIVSDPDQLLSEQDVLRTLEERGFDIIPFDDHVAFRYAYESRYRKRWDQGQATNLVVVLRSPSDDFDDIPFDLLEQARRQERCLRFSIGDLFPFLVPNLVSELDRVAFDALYEAHEKAEKKKLGLDATKDFILQHVFDVVPQQVKSESDLLRVLLRRHYRAQNFPASLDDRFISQLNATGLWEEWPLEQIVPDRAAFLEFLQERWPHFLTHVVHGKPGLGKEPGVVYDLKIPGPVDLPFGHDDVKVYIDNLFQDGFLTPSVVVDQENVPEDWMRVGVVGPGGRTQVDRATRLFERLRDTIPGFGDPHQSWIDFAQTWGEWTALRWSIGEDSLQGSKVQREAVHAAVEESFAGWMAHHFASLHNLSFVNAPVMVHHIPHHMGHRFTRTADGTPRKHALLVIDGLAMDQWAVLRDVLRDQLDVRTRFKEGGAFAWVPTLTGVSRQAIFSGFPPFLFSPTLGSTHKEPAQWQKFWEERGASRDEIRFVKEGKQEGDETFLKRVLQESQHPKARVLAIVVNKVDQSMHGVVTGTSGLHSVIRDWAKGGAPAGLLGALLADGYEIFLTSDHGNIQASGIGKPNVGVVAEDRGVRAHVFNDELVRSNVASDFPGTIKWPQIGLPESYKPLLAPGRGAFLPKGKGALGHGGITMEEVIVPFVGVREVEE